MKNFYKEEIKKILQENNKENIENLFNEARKKRDKIFYKQSQLRATIEISNVCRGTCLYCAINSKNKTLERYRMKPDEIFNAAVEIQKNKINTVFLQSGEDPKLLSYLVPAIKKIKDKLPKMTIILGNGERTKKEYDELKKSGADKYILKFETANEKLYKKIRPYSTLENRLNCIAYLKKIGFEIGTGNIIGLPNQSLNDIVDDILLVQKINPEMVSTTPFIPNKNTVLKNAPAGDFITSLKVMALFRLILPEALIPTTSALDKVMPDKGQIMGFNAGANVITINATPLKYRLNYPIYSDKRPLIKLDHALNAIKNAKLSLT